MSTFNLCIIFAIKSVCTVNCIWLSVSFWVKHSFFYSKQVPPIFSHYQISIAVGNNRKLQKRCGKTFNEKTKNTMVYGCNEVNNITGGKNCAFGMRLECPRQKIVIGRKYRGQKKMSKFTELSWDEINVPIIVPWLVL